jgi:hypothetical protein
MAFIQRPDQQQLKEHLAEYLVKTGMRSERNDHKTIETWFSRLRLFYGMPFNYIVPDERMLPTESLRFFQVDNNWMDALIDGAFSIGSSKPLSSNTQLTAHIAALRESAKQKMGTIRANILSKATGPAAEKAKKYIQEYHALESDNLSGFILRSMVITGWPGIQVHGFSDAAATKPVPILRMEKLSSTLLFVIFEGMVQSVIFEEPSEGVHFGVTPDTNPITTELRYAQTGAGVTSGQVITDQEAYPVPMRSTSTLNVLRANTFAQQLINQPTVWPPGTTAPYPAFTAAQFALEMVQGVQSVQFTCSATPKAISNES